MVTPGTAEGVSTRREWGMRLIAAPAFAFVSSALAGPPNSSGPRPRAVVEHQIDINSSGIRFSPDGLTLAVADCAGAVRLWDVRDGGLRSILEKGKEVRRRTNWSRRDFPDAIFEVAFSSDGRLLATGGLGRNLAIHVWNVEAGRLQTTLQEERVAITALVFSPNGKMLAQGSDEGIIRLWDVDQGRVHATLGPIGGQVSSLVFSPDGRTLAAGGWDDYRTIRLWDVEEGRVSSELSGHTKGIETLAADHNGRWLASASNDRTAKIWYLRAAREPITLSGHSGAVIGVDISPDDRMIATACSDKMVRLWDLSDTPTLRLTLHHDSWVRCVLFSPDRRTLGTVARPGVIRLWDIPTLLESQRREGQ